MIESEYFKKIDLFIRNINHKRIDLMRAFRLRIFLLLFNQKNDEKNINFNNQFDVSNLGRQNLKKVFILRLDGKLGDTITMTGFLSELHSNNIEIYIVTKKQQDFIYNFIPIPVRLYTVTNLLSCVLLLFKMRRIYFDYLICSTHLIDPISLFLSRFINAQNKMTFLNKEIRFFNHHVFAHFENIHITERYGKFLEFMEVKPSSKLKQYTIKLPSIENHKCEIECARYDFKLEGYIVINSFSGSTDRNLSFEVTIAIVKGLKIALPHYKIVSIANENDLNILKSWQAQASLDGWFIFDKSDFGFNALLIQKSCLVITPDTAIIHLASAFNRKIVGLYRVFGSEKEFPIVWCPSVSEENYAIVYGYRGVINSIDPQEVVRCAVKLIKS